jgi:hypothetical protein
VSPHPDDLNELERRLAACAPSSAGLDADAMLFAAGRASARPSAARFVWPALTATLAGLAALLGVWLANERSERLALIRQLRPVPPAVAPYSPPPAEPWAQAESSSLDLLAVHHALEQGRDPWPAQMAMRVDAPSELSPSPVLQASSLKQMLDR